MRDVVLGKRTMNVKPFPTPPLRTPTGSAVQFHELLDHCQSNTQSWNTKERRCLALAKEIKDLRQHFLGDSDASVTDMDDDRATVLPGG